MPNKKPTKISKDLIDGTGMTKGERVLFNVSWLVRKAYLSFGTECRQTCFVLVVFTRNGERSCSPF